MSIMKSKVMKKMKKVIVMKKYVCIIVCIWYER